MYIFNIIFQLPHICHIACIPKESSQLLPIKPNNLPAASSATNPKFKFCIF